MPKPLLTPEQVAKKLGIAESDVAAHIRRGTLPTVLSGGQHCVSQYAAKRLQKRLDGKQ